MIFKDASVIVSPIMLPARARLTAIVLVLVFTMGGLLGSFDACEMKGAGPEVSESGAFSACHDAGGSDGVTHRHVGTHCGCSCHAAPFPAAFAHERSPRAIEYLAFVAGAELVTRTDALDLQPPIAG